MPRGFLRAKQGIEVTTRVLVPSGYLFVTAVASTRWCPASNDASHWLESIPMALRVTPLDLNGSIE
jgi:hypothetical protein